MAQRLSANGKRLGRPPGTKTATAQQPTINTAALANYARAIKARYDAAGQGKRMASWKAPSTGPNTAIQGLQTIRNRSRDANRNDWAGASSTQKWSTALIGIGIVPRFRRIKSKTRRQEIIDIWTDFVAEIDSDCVNNAYGMQTLAVKSFVADGEVFARRRPRFPDAGFAVPMQVQLLESDMVPMLDAITWPGLPAGNVIKSGIELDKRGTRIAYWVYKQHPGDFMINSTVEPNNLVRVAASDMIHMFEQQRPGQLRGVSMLAPVLARLRNIGDYEDTTLERQKIANLFVGFIKRTLPTLDPNEINAGALTGLEQEVDLDSGAGLIPLKPGLIQELEDGQEFDFSNPPEAGTTYSDYMRTSHLGTAAAAGIPYELYSGDILNISDRTLRVLINEFRRLAEQRQWQIVIPQFCQRVVNWFADAAALVGAITLDEVDSVRRCEHAPHGWAYIHPTQDVQGKALEVANGFRSRSSVIAERGDDPDTVDDERAADQARDKALGLTENAAPAAATPAPPAKEPSPAPQQDMQKQPSAAARRAELAEIKRIEAETELLRARAKQVGEPTTLKVDPVAENQLAFQNRILELLA